MGYRRWTPEEVEALEEKWGVVSIDGIAKYLGRSKSGVQVKAGKLGLGDSRIAGEKISLNQFSQATGICPYTIKQRWMKAGFKCTELKQSNHKTYKIDLNYFWKWAAKHKDLINFAKWEEGMLGAEPEWAKEKRRADMMDPSKVNHNRLWTKEDDMLLVQKTKTCKYTYADLATEFNRTEGAVKRRLLELKVPCRPVPRDTHEKWSHEENEKMIELSKKGYSTAAIAKVLNKTQLSLCDRLKKYSVGC